MISRQHVVREFFGQAEALREALDQRFKEPYVNPIQWEYFCDPGEVHVFAHGATARVPKGGVSELSGGSADMVPGQSRAGPRGNAWSAPDDERMQIGTA
jgi:hypothetical protein